jgi:hypothetical protein
MAISDTFQSDEFLEQFLTLGLPGIVIILLATLILGAARFNLMEFPNFLASIRIRKLFCICGPASKIVSYIWTFLFILFITVGVALLVAWGAMVCLFLSVFHS